MKNNNIILETTQFSQREIWDGTLRTKNRVIMDFRKPTRDRINQMLIDCKVNEFAVNKTLRFSYRITRDKTFYHFVRPSEYVRFTSYFNEHNDGSFKLTLLTNSIVDISSEDGVGCSITKI